MAKYTPLKIVFKTETRCSGTYLRSSFYKGTILWNGLRDDVQKSDTVTEFMQNIDRMYDVYEEIW